MQGRVGSKTTSTTQRVKARPPLPFSESDVEEGRAEWKNIPEAVRTAILALARSLGETGTELDQLKAESNPQELKQTLKQEISLKANTEEVKQTLNTIAQAVEDRIHRTELEAVLANYVREDDVVKALEETVSKRDVTKMLERKLDQEEIKIQLAQVHQRLDKLTSELTALSARSVGVNDLSLVREKLERKVDMDTFQATIRLKANLEDVQEELNKKVDIEELDSLLAYKADGREIEDLSKIIEMKADQEGLDQVWEAFSTKADAKDLELVRVGLNRKADSKALESQADAVNQLQQEVQEIVKSIEGVFEENRVVIEKMRSQTDGIMKELLKKPNKSDLAELRTLLSKKVEGALFIEELGKVKEEVAKDLRNYKLELEKYKRAQDDKRLEKEQTETTERKELREIVNQVREQQDEILGQKAQEYDQLLKYIQNVKDVCKDDCKLKHESLFSEIKDFKKVLDQMERKKLNGEEARNFFGQLEGALTTKASIDEVQSSLNSMHAELATQQSQILEEVSNRLKTVEYSFNERISKKASAVQVEKQLAMKIDAEGLEQTIENLLKSVELDGLAARVSQIEQKTEYAQSRSPDSMIKAIQMDLQDVKKGVAIKANLEDVLRILDQKCGRCGLKQTSMR